jgi:hypothetical protein
MTSTCVALPVALEALSDTFAVPAAFLRGTPEMVARPAPELFQLRPLGRTEWSRAGTGSPTAVTVKENRWPTVAVAAAALMKTGAWRADVDGWVVGGAVVTVVGATELVAPGVTTGKTGRVGVETAATVRSRV